MNKQQLVKIHEENIDKARTLYPSLSYKIRYDLERSIAVTIPDFVLPKNWKNVGHAVGSDCDNPQLIFMQIILPPDFPERPPSGIYFDKNLRMSDGTLPKYGFGGIFKDSKHWLFCCMNIPNWNKKCDNLWKYLKLAYHYLEQYNTNATFRED